MEYKVVNREQMCLYEAFAFFPLFLEDVNLLFSLVPCRLNEYTHTHTHARACEGVVQYIPRVCVAAAD